MRPVIVGILLLSGAYGNFNPVRNSVEGVTCQGTFNSKVGRPSPGINTYNGGDKNDFSTDGGNTSQGVGSNDGDKLLPGDSKYLLCPNDGMGGGVTYYAYDYGYNQIMTTYVPAGGVCWMEIVNQEYKASELKFAEMFSENVKVSVYYKQAYNQYQLLENIDYDNKDYVVKVPNFKSAFLVVKSTTPSRIGKFSIKTKAVIDRSLSTVAIVGIVIGSISFGGIVAFFMFGGVRGYNKRKQLKAKKKLADRMQSHSQSNSYHPPNPPNVYIRMPEIPEASCSNYDESGKHGSSSKESNEANTKLPYRPVSGNLA